MAPLEFHTIIRKEAVVNVVIIAVVVFILYFAGVLKQLASGLRVHADVTIGFVDDTGGSQDQSQGENSNADKHGARGIFVVKFIRILPKLFFSYSLVLAEANRMEKFCIGDFYRYGKK